MSKRKHKQHEEVKKLATRTDEYAGSLRERAMVVRFATGRWYGRGADEDVVADLRQKHNAKGDIGVFTKRLMSREVMKDFDQAVNDARRIHKRMTMPWTDGGARLLPSALYFDYRKQMTACEMRFVEAVEVFLKNFPKYLEEERKRLNGLFRERDYPSIDGLRARFKWKLSIEPIASAEDFRVDLGEDEMKRVRAQIEEEVGAALHQASKDVWERMYEAVGRIKEKMTESDPSVRANLFEGVREIVALLPKLNVSNDPKLAAMGDRLTKELLDGADVEALKASSKERTDVARKADKILDAMKSFLG